MYSKIPVSLSSYICSKAFQSISSVNIFTLSNSFIFYTSLLYIHLTTDFIEVDSDEEGNKYLVIHSGSRNLGKQVAEYYQDLAIKRCRSNDIQYVIADLKAQGRFSEIESVPHDT